MERKKPQMDQQKWKALQNYADNGKGLLRALAGYSYYRYGGNWYTELWNALTKLYSKPITQLSAKEFLCRDLENAFTTLAPATFSCIILFILSSFFWTTENIGDAFFIKKVTKKTRKGRAHAAIKANFGA